MAHIKVQWHIEGNIKKVFEDYLDLCCDHIKFCKGQTHLLNLNSHKKKQVETLSHNSFGFGH